MSRSTTTSPLLLLVAALCFSAMLATAPACPMCKAPISPEEELKALAARLEEERARKPEGNAQAARLEAAIANKQYEQQLRDASMRGYFWSILFMLLIPTALLAGLVGVLTLSARRSRARHAQLLARFAPATGAPLPDA